MVKISKNNLILQKNVSSKSEVFELLAKKLQELGFVTDGYAASMKRRDDDISVNLGSGVAIPHANKGDEHLVLNTGVVVLTLAKPIKWSDDEDDVQVLFGIASKSTEHMSILTNITRLVTTQTDKIKEIINDSTGDVIVDFFNSEKAPITKAKATPGKGKYYIGITSCPTGVAHTFMAAAALKDRGEELGYEVKIETQGSDGQQNRLTPDDVARAEAVIIAADVKVELGRFAGKKVLQTSTKAAIERGETLFAEADNAPIYGNGASNKGGVLGGEMQVGDAETFGEVFAQSKRHLMSGVSHIIPIVVIGGILIAAAIALSGVEPGKGANVTNPFLLTVLNIGAASFSMMVPVLAGYIAFSIAGKPGLAPGLVAGVIASSIKAGFLGGILGGFIAGAIAWWLNRNVKLPTNFVTVKTIFIIPIVTGLATGLLMYYVIGDPIAWLMTSMTAGLQSMSGSSSVLLGIVLGAMIALDMGGPVNKVAFLFGVAMISENVFTVMGACAVAIGIPPISCGVHTLIAKHLYSNEEQDAGRAALLMGLIGITEGAIPFAVSDPLRVIPSIVLGAAAGGGVAGLLGVGDHAPHGSFIVLPVVDNRIGFVIAFAVGVAVAVTALHILKSMAAKKKAMA